ncbi:MAG: hypothetical protein KDE24_01060 [Caldilinea sp.]|nr:hypothetical protein [Caldilinea sp.]
MQLALSFSDIVDAADHLTLAEQESLIDILSRRLAENRRAELAQDVHDARQEYHRGQTQAATADDIMNDLLS